MTQEEKHKERSLSANAIILTISKVINTVIALLSAMLLARFRSLQEYGTYSQITTIVGLTISIVMLGLPNSMNYFIARAREQEERDRFLSLYFGIVTAISVFTGLFLILASPLICRYYKNAGIKSFNFVLGILPWTMVVTTSISNMLVAVNKTNRLLVYNVLRSLSTLSVIVIVRILNQDFMFYMVLYVVSESIFTLWVYYEACRLMNRMYFNVNLDLLKRVFSFSIPMGLAAAVGTLDVYLDHLMVGYYFDTETLAIFSNAGKELPFTIFASAITAVLVPHMAREFREGKIEEPIRTWSIATELNAIILVFCATTCVVFAPQIMTILYSEKYLLGVPVFRVYALVLILRITYFGMALNAIGKSKFIFYSSVAALVANIVLNFILINLFGALGAASATLISHLIIALFQLKMTSKVVGIEFRRIFPWKHVAQILVLNMVWGTIAYVIMSFFSIGTSIKEIVLSIVFGLVLLFIYALICKKRFVYLYKAMGR